MRPNPVTNTPLDALWQATALLWVLLAGEGVAVVLALAPGVTDDRLIYFGLTSLMVQWVSLLALAGLYVLRRQLSGVRPQYVAYLALCLLVLATWLVCGTTWLVLREAWPMARGADSRNLASSP